MSWDVKYRPMKFADVLGQDGTVTLLKKRLSLGTALSTNYIFAGAWGGGKTTIARILARALLCVNIKPEDPEPCNTCDNCATALDGTSIAVREEDAASNGTIEHIRGLVDDLPFAVQGAEKRVWIFDECHRLGIGAQDVLLKPLEERKFVGIFCTTEFDKIRGAIRSRCEEYVIRTVTREDLFTRMVKVLKEEGVSYEDEAVYLVIDGAHGHIRDILNKLEMISQTGVLSKDAAKLYLNLTTVTYHYNLLLSLGDPLQAIQICETMLEKETPEEAAAGLADVAMASFRHSLGLPVSSTLLDRELTPKLWAAYGPMLVKMAEWFLRSRTSTKVGLQASVLQLTSGAVPEEVPPVQVQGVFQKQPPPENIHASVTNIVEFPSVTHKVTPSPPPAPVITQPVKQPPPVKPVTSPAPEKPIVNGPDPEALYPSDHKGLHPVPRNDKLQAVVKKVIKKQPVDPLFEPLSPTDFKREFLLRWRTSLWLLISLISG